MKQVGILLAVFLWMGAIIAQQIPLFSNYNASLLTVNPAYAGSKEKTVFSLVNRNQWIGFKGAPTTQALNIHTPILYRNMGVGLALLKDKIGPLSNTSIHLNFAYQIKLSKSSYIAMGIRGGGDFMAGSFNQLKTIESEDPLLLNTSIAIFSPNFGVGAYYKCQKAFIGFSVPYLIKHQYSPSSSAILYSLKQHFYLTAGMNEKLKMKMQYIPSLIVKYTQAAPIQLELTNILKVKNKYEIGLAYRLTDAYIALLGIQITNKVKLGYSFDWSFANRTFKNNQGSHEVYLRYSPSLTKKIEEVTPRYL
ncbi:MAG: type IX secretion system membrane protein PorP/SprF [Flavobacteriales bacterium]|jgi:type IX secretion system PorP/SprF family membrane protein|nr:type IX secretion system membrane protein PorP/SprF [Flavobacteriales bacterium]